MTNETEPTITVEPPTDAEAKAKRLAKLSKSELIAIAERLGLEVVADERNKASIIEAILATGVNLVDLGPGIVVETAEPEELPDVELEEGQLIAVASTKGVKHGVLVQPFVNGKGFRCTPKTYAGPAFDVATEAEIGACLP